MEIHSHLVDGFMNVLLAFVVFLGLLSRCYLIYKYKWFGVDTFRNFVYANNFKKNNRKIVKFERVPRDTKYFLAGLPYLLSFFEQKHHQRLQYLSPIFDILNLLLCQAICFLFRVRNIANFYGFIMLYFYAFADLSIM